MVTAIMDVSWISQDGGGQEGLEGREADVRMASQCLLSAGRLGLDLVDLIDPSPTNARGFHGRGRLIRHDIEGRRMDNAEECVKEWL